MKKIFLVILTIVLLFIACSPEEDVTENEKEAVVSDKVIQNEVEDGYMQYVSSSGLSLVAESTWRQVGGEQELCIELERDDGALYIGKGGKSFADMLLRDYLTDIYEPINLSSGDVDEICNSSNLGDYNFRIDRSNLGAIRYVTAFGKEVPIFLVDYTANGGEDISVEANIFYHGSSYRVNYSGKRTDNIVNEIEKVLSTLKDEEYDQKELKKYCKSLTKKEWSFIGDNKNKIVVKFIPDEKDITFGKVYVDGEYVGMYFACFYQEEDDYINMDFFIRGSYYGYTAPGHCYSTVSVQFDGRKCEIYVINGEGDEKTYILK